VVQPVSVQIKEQEPGTFLVQWQVPKAIPYAAMPDVALPEECRSTTPRTVQELPGSWLNRRTHVCADGLAGRSVSIQYPIVSPGQGTLLRFESLSGTQLVHMLNPGEDSWQVPEERARLLEAPWKTIRSAVLDGLAHLADGWWHLALILAVCLLGGTVTALGLVTALAGGQLLGVGLSLALGSELPSPLAECGIAVAIVLLARNALRDPAGRLPMVGVALAAGLVHGLGVPGVLPPPSSFGDHGWLYLVLAVLGMDAGLLVLALAAQAIGRFVRGRSWSRATSRVLSYVLGGGAVAAALSLVLIQPAAEAETSADAGRLPSLAGESNDLSGKASQRVAPQNPDQPIQSFVAVEAFEVRHEILVRLQDVSGLIGLPETEYLEIEDQQAVKERVGQMVVPLARVHIDGTVAEPLVDRIDFLTVGNQGVLPRPDPVRELLNEAYVGVTAVYTTPRTPDLVTLGWETFPGGITEIPTTITDPETSQTATLSADQPMVSWQNELMEDPAPTVTAIVVEPRTLPVPVLALFILAISALVLIFLLRRGKSATSFALARVSLALALLIAPLGQVAIALPSSLGAVPSTDQARRILAAVLPNVYRAFEFREESAVYDRLAVSVTGETLTDVYLEHRRALEMVERGGARARVEAVEVSEVRSVEAVADSGFDVQATWTVGGTVTHFGHRHFRQNRYDARVTLVPVEGSWKIRAIELLDEVRLK
ncbi:MAG: HupE/UreJ family protein, partial [Thermoanaerobaculia bacterium]